MKENKKDIWFYRINDSYFTNYSSILFLPRTIEGYLATIIFILLIILISVVPFGESIFMKGVSYFLVAMVIVVFYNFASSKSE